MTSWLLAQGLFNKGRQHHSGFGFFIDRKQIIQITNRTFIQVANNFLTVFFTNNWNMLDKHMMKQTQDQIIFLQFKKFQILPPTWKKSHFYFLLFNRFQIWETTSSLP